MSSCENGSDLSAKKVMHLNKYLDNLDNDILYHLGMSTKTHDFKHLFGDVKFVCMGGTADRMKKLATLIAEYLELTKNFSSAELENLSENADRYVIYKVGPVLCVNHGIGMASTSIVLHEIFKLLQYAACSNVVFIRLGTCGGIGVEPGTVVISDEAFNGGLEPYFETFASGKRVQYEAHFDADLIQNFERVGKECNLPVSVGKTVSCDDFYEAGGRLDGAFCCYEEKDKMDFLQRAYLKGVKNMEMEAMVFGAMTHRAGHRCAVLCVTLLNRLIGDQVKTDIETLKSWEERPCRLVATFIKESLTKIS